MPKNDIPVMMPRAANKPEDYTAAIEQMGFMYDNPGSYAMLIHALIDYMLVNRPVHPSGEYMIDEEMGYLKHFLPQYFSSLPEASSENDRRLQRRLALEKGDLPMPHRRGNKRWDIKNHRWV